MASFSRHDVRRGLKSLRWPLAMTRAGMFAEALWQSTWPLVTVVLAVLAVLMLGLQDSVMVEKAQGLAKEIAESLEQAIENGDLTAAQVFDQDYQPIPGSNPKRYRNGMSDWADKVWQPMLDRETNADPKIQAVACTDSKGFLPTHLSDKSRAPTGDLAHDTMYCRNGRILFEPIDQKAKASNAPYMMAVYRQEGDGTTYEVVRNVYIPLFVNGRRWGDYEVAYTFR